MILTYEIETKEEAAIENAGLLALKKLGVPMQAWAETPETCEMVPLERVGKACYQIHPGDKIQTRGSRKTNDFSVLVLYK